VIRAVIAMGANLGERAETIAAAIERLAATDGVDVVAVSELVETVAIRPDGPDDTHPNYLNGVAIVDTTLTAASLLAVLHAIEDEESSSLIAELAKRLEIPVRRYNNTSFTHDWLNNYHRRLLAYLLQHRSHIAVWNMCDVFDEWFKWITLRSLPSK
jgi:2-amino-4-hydroxy-6-hydroxymethyldihydropteridine diphosphokinase